MARLPDWDQAAADLMSARGQLSEGARGKSTSPKEQSSFERAPAGHFARLPRAGHASTGPVDLALRFEGLFRLPSGRPPLIRLEEVRLTGATISSLISERRRIKACR